MKTLHMQMNVLVVGSEQAILIETKLKVGV